ncbi:hypothetical protein JQS43_05910 [Natronosporangium hydrolyticum]|uniref:Uncharacterized protein n=1 Tax=Natronosporangium hydrolyticum TaxID=2811111 RepID=A0A895YME8_9ACTN|nr:hypothetical protein [Natronosporangium hydrolyticum]QSB15866.1 hypothetical protein JQS43_05910 [Natronosporangium hydrolyticum]
MMTTEYLTSILAKTDARERRQAADGYRKGRLARRRASSRRAHDELT